MAEKPFKKSPDDKADEIFGKATDEDSNVGMSEDREPEMNDPVDAKATDTKPPREKGLKREEIDMGEKSVKAAETRSPTQNFSMGGDDEVDESPVKQKRVTIRLEEQDNSDMNTPQLVTDGTGKQFLIKRGYDVTVPEGVLNTLLSRKYTIIEKDENGEDVVRDIPRFAVTVVSREA